ncbi:CPBP family intramembrane metalloprotease, partial [Clostridia bacterium OttesenSCG-928-O13]|nr:CPBP family intramembrane metalloprotease [Clostridia bacterium OttesenSCG-928-O13]
RGMVQPMLRGFGARLSIAATSILFTLMHASVWEVPSIFVLSLLLGYVGYISRSVRPCIVLHIANNSFIFFSQLARENMEVMQAFALIFVAVLAFVALFAGAVWAVRHFRLGPKLKLPSARKMGPLRKRVLRLLRVPMFTAGAAVCLLYFILGVV